MTRSSGVGAESDSSGIDEAAAQALIDASISTAAASYVTKALYDANTILAATSDNTPAALTIAASRFVGRKASGDIAAMTVAEAKTLLAIAISDVTSLQATLDAKALQQEVSVADTGVTGTKTVADVTTATLHRYTLTGNVTLTFPSVPSAGTVKSFTLVLTQDGTGSRIVTWPSSIVKWAGGSAPTLSTGAGKIDVITFTSYDGTNWSGFVAGLDVR